MTSIYFPAVLPGDSTFTAVVKDVKLSPAFVLDAAQDFIIDVKWKISPALAALLGGQFEVKAYSETYGPGPAPMQIGETMLCAITGGTEYGTKVTVKAGTFPNLDPTRPATVSGVYKILTVLSHLNDAGKYTDLCAIAENETVHIG